MQHGKINVKDRVPYSFKTQAQIRELVEAILHFKWNWAKDVARYSGGRWTRDR